MCAQAEIQGACHKETTFYAAHGICSAIGARLCNVEELRRNVALGTGCGLGDGDTTLYVIANAYSRLLILLLFITVARSVELEDTHSAHTVLLRGDLLPVDRLA